MKMKMFEFQMKISLKYVSDGSFGNKSGAEPLSEPVMTQFTDAYRRHQASNELTNGNNRIIITIIPPCSDR